MFLGRHKSIIMKKGLKKMINNKTEENNKLYNVQVTRAHFIKNEELEQVIGFDMKVNGINIYGAIYRSGTSKKNKEYELISFPAREGTGKHKGKYFNHVYFPINDNLLNEIKDQLGKAAK